MTIKHTSNMQITVTVRGCPLSGSDAEYIRTLDTPIYHNDTTGKLWCFDTKLPSGRWLENLHPSNDLRTATAHVYGDGSEVTDR